MNAKIDDGSTWINDEKRRAFLTAIAGGERGGTLHPSAQTKAPTTRRFKSALGVAVFILFFALSVVNNNKALRSLSQLLNADVHSELSAHPALDPERTDCSYLLKKFKADEIEEAKREGEVNFRRSFVTITKDVPHPFYVSTHDKQIDRVRASIMTHHMYYESALTSLIADTFVKARDEGREAIFLDVGANIGWFSLVAAAHGASKVYSFEPNLQNTIRFCESLRLNGWADGDLVVPVTKGVGRVEERRELRASPKNLNNPGAYSFNKDGPVVAVMNITTLDLFSERHGWFDLRPSIGCFKLDVEYFEQEVIEGAEKLLKSRIIEMIAMELKPDHTEDAKLKICTILMDAGYELVMHGASKGPNKVVGKKYQHPSDLVKDFQGGMYKENVLFRLKK